jgi:hypothetical protein
MASSEPGRNYAADLVDLVGAFSDNGKSLRSFINNPHELGICVLTAGLMANSKLNLRPDDAIKSSFEIYSKIQRHVGNYQNLAFAATVDEAFQPHPETGPRQNYNERPAETDGD